MSSPPSPSWSSPPSCGIGCGPSDARLVRGGPETDSMLRRLSSPRPLRVYPASPKGEGSYVLTFFQAIVVGIIQGVSELFPVSSLGHSVLLPALFGWHNLVTDQSQGESFYLAFVVGLHVATALALIAFFWRDWVRIIGGF